jgi:hypothetical protein
LTNVNIGKAIGLYCLLEFSDLSDGLQYFNWPLHFEEVLKIIAVSSEMSDEYNLFCGLYRDSSSFVMKNLTSYLRDSVFCDYLIFESGSLRNSRLLEDGSTTAFLFLAAKYKNKNSQCKQNIKISCTCDQGRRKHQKLGGHRFRGALLE